MLCDTCAGGRGVCAKCAMKLEDDNDRATPKKSKTETGEKAEEEEGRQMEESGQAAELSEEEEGDMDISDDEE